MAAAWAIIWCVILATVSGQKLGNSSYESHGICTTKHCLDLDCLKSLKNCVIIIGSLTIGSLKKMTVDDFRYNQYKSDLREVTQYVKIHRLVGLESFGQLFPNLARIRGEVLFYDYALIIFDSQDLIEIGLYSLIKIDRGGVIVLGGIRTCYVNTVNWKALAASEPRQIYNVADNDAQCPTECRCSTNSSIDYCWNYKKCQRFLEGPEGENAICNKECVGCRKTITDECTMCRHFTYRGRCLKKCPDKTIKVTVYNYCVTMGECKALGGWKWDGSCVFKCPIGYTNVTIGNITTCKRCADCNNCSSLFINAIASLQAAAHCVNIQGSLTIKMRVTPNAMDALHKYLNRLETVRDYIYIHQSHVITSLHFFSSLKRIGGQELIDDKYSLKITRVYNLRKLFLSSVLRNLQIDNGTLCMINNPVVNVNDIAQLKKKFPRHLTPFLPIGLNGYSGGCTDLCEFKVLVINETSVAVFFWPSNDVGLVKSVLYARLPTKVKTKIYPEDCGKCQWNSLLLPSSNATKIEITTLKPASTYLICLEVYNENKDQLIRSALANFTTTVGKPEPPFITELSATSSTTVVMRWLTHKYYRPHITHYEVVVALVDIPTKDINARSHCEDQFDQVDHSRHKVLQMPPSDYVTKCESNCGAISNVASSVGHEDNFDLEFCRSFECNDIDEPDVPANSSFNSYLRTKVLKINASENDFVFNNLAPFRDYRFRIRACVSDVCSRSALSSVRTLKEAKADVATLTFVNLTKPGKITFKWKPPDVTNGPILAYYLSVIPMNVTSIGVSLPQVWCQAPSVVSLKVNTKIINFIYMVNICVHTLGSYRSCSEWKIIELKHSVNESVISTTDKPYVERKHNVSWLWISVIFSVILCAVSLIIGFVWRTRKANDAIPLVDMMHNGQNESESYSNMWTIPLQ